MTLKRAMVASAAALALLLSLSAAAAPTKIQPKSVPTPPERPADAKAPLTENQNTSVPQAGEFRQFLESIWPNAEKAGVSRATFDDAISGLTPDEAILTRPSTQAEFTITIAQYLAQSVTAKRAEQGRAVAGNLSDPLEKIQGRHGVPWEILVAIWGIESNYGSSGGKSDILRVLATLAFKQHRGSLFLDAFVAALVMLQKGYAKREHP